MNYEELSSLGKMAYARYRDTPPTITAEQVQALAKLTTVEKKLYFRCLKQHFETGEEDD